MRVWGREVESCDEKITMVDDLVIVVEFDAGVRATLPLTPLVSRIRHRGFLVRF